MFGFLVAYGLIKISAHNIVDAGNIVANVANNNGTELVTQLNNGNNDDTTTFVVNNGTVKLNKTETTHNLLLNDVLNNGTTIITQSGKPN